MALCRLSLIIGIALVLLSCLVEPVDRTDFFNSLPKPEVGVDIDYKVSDESPKLQWSANEGTSWTALGKGVTVTISLNASPGTVIIQVIDSDDFDITWYCDSLTALTAGQGVTGTNNERLVITPGTAPFTDAKIYQMSVVWTKDEQKYGTSVFIRVGN